MLLLIVILKTIVIFVLYKQVGDYGTITSNLEQNI